MLDEVNHHLFFSMPHRILSLEEVSEYLHMSEKALQALVRGGEIPHEKNGDRVSFRKVEIDAWASHRLMESSETDIETFHKKSSAKQHDLSDSHSIMPEMLHASGIIADLSCRTKPSTITAMVDLADKTGLLIHKEDLHKSIVDRENLGTTALRGGVALLHPQHHDPYTFDDSFIVFGRNLQRIPFGSPDGKTTDLFFMICCQDDSIHLHLLARLCMMCYHTRLLYELREAETTDEIRELILDAEAEVIKLRLEKKKKV